MIDAEERAAMAASVRAALRNERVTSGTSTDGDAILAELGWLEMLAEQPDDAIDVVFSALGATNAVATAIDDALARRLGVAPRPNLAVMLPPFGRWQAPGDIRGNTLTAEGLASARATRATDVLIACAKNEGVIATVVPTSSTEVTPIRGIDPNLGLCSIRVSGQEIDGSRLSQAQWSAAVAFGQRSLAHQIGSACRTMIELARTHALEREQFGRPIARFQAVRHRLAESLVAVEALEAALEAARDEQGPETAALAKAAAGDAARTVRAHCQQVLAGIGFTEEHAFHQFMKRAMALEGLFGSCNEIMLDFGRRLLEQRDVPTLIEL